MLKCYLRVLSVHRVTLEDRHLKNTNEQLIFAVLCWFQDIMLSVPNPVIARTLDSVKGSLWINESWWWTKCSNPKRTSQTTTITPQT